MLYSSVRKRLTHFALANHGTIALVKITVFKDRRFKQNSLLYTDILISVSWFSRNSRAAKDTERNETIY